ncbi:membrane protein [Flavobacterium orientale]|uniref:Membrane protein n=1 Tax=Flavobacterium orientale TaxID=1756020 RepID=A0A916Y2W9_9FLAO|nr:membrane protein [Flavobacterium orientale]
MIWNLFLGGIPYFIAQFLKLSIKFQENKWLRISTLLVWLLFLPNSFYILTDFFHLNKFNSVPVWYDLLVVATFSITGFLFGLYSLFTIQKILTIHHSKNLSRIIVFLSVYLTAFGIYLGRYLRFNSWDVITNPIDLFTNLFSSLFSTEVQQFTIGFGTFLFVIYFVAATLTFKNQNT